MTDKNGSGQSIADATRSRASFSGHISGGGAALGAAGYREASDHPENCEFLNEPGASIAVCSGEHPVESIMIGAAWDNVKTQKAGFFGKLFKKARGVGVDLDVGCLYELQDGSRGALQAFGNKFGRLDQPPYIALSADERTGDAEGNDEYLLINGKNWSKIKRVLVYLYIYKGVLNWSELKPQLVVDVPGESDLYVTLQHHNDALDICAVGGIENIRGGIKLTNYTEYFPGHMEMDRAFGFGLDWADGQKE